MTDINNQKIVELIQEICRPVSIFLYGSRARGDHFDDSDYEIGVVYDEATPVSRTTLASRLADTNVHAYPCSYEQLRNGRIDTPFQIAVFLRELHLSARTLDGEPLVESMIPPPITTLDALQDVRFAIGRSISAVLADRFHESAVAIQSFYKSCLLGVRMAVLAQLREFPVSYQNIAERALTICPDEHSHVITQALESRLLGRSPTSRDVVYDNIALLTGWVEPLLLELHPKPCGAVLLE